MKEVAKCDEGGSCDDDNGSERLPADKRDEGA